MRTIVALVPLMLLGILGLRSGDTVRLRCDADTNLSSYDSEKDLNYGASPRIRLKGIQMLGLFHFETGSVAGSLVRSARLHLRYAGNARMLRTLGISTVTAPWEEGTGRGEHHPGEPSFQQRRAGRDPWAPTATDFAEVIFEPPGIWGFADARDEGDGWVSCEVPTDAVQALIAGLATGLVVTDEKGQTMANNDVFSREQAGSEPYLTVQVTAARSSAPSPVSDVNVEPLPDTTDARYGSLRVRFSVPEGALGVRAACTRLDSGERVKEDVVALGAAGAQTYVIERLPPGTRLSLALTAVGPTGRPSEPVVAHAVTPPPRASVRRLPRARLLSTLQIAPWLRCGAVDVTLGAFGERFSPHGASQSARSRLWNGKAVVLQTARGATARAVLVVRYAPRTHLSFEVRVRGGILARTSYLRPIDDAGLRPEACLPVSGPVELANGTSAADSPCFQQFLVELCPAMQAQPGIRHGTLDIFVNGNRTRSISLMLWVRSAVVPDRPRFDLSLNTYGSPARAMGLDPATREGLAAEHAYHRLAHENRGTLTPLGYSHSGNVEPGYAPPTTGSGSARRVSDWAEWDRRFGPLLDGSAFEGCVRSRIPVTHLYLPFHEAWPENIREHYAYKPATHEYPQVIIDHALNAGPLDQVASSAYAAGIEAVVRDFAHHIRARGWRQTLFHFYLNNKYYYKDPALGGRGTSWWLLDEPMHRDDWLALAWFARRMQAGLAGIEDHRFVFREDVSRPQWQHDYLDGLVNLMVVNDELFRRPALMRRFTERGVRLWHYGSPPPIRAELSDCELWPVRAYLAGADGIVPWQTIGQKANYTTPEPTALILPSLDETVRQPVATLRLKALARGAEDVELLRLLAQHKGWDRRQTAAAVAPFLEDADLEGMRAAIFDAVEGSSHVPSALSHAAHKSGHVRLAMPRSPRPKP